MHHRSAVWLSVPQRCGELVYYTRTSPLQGLLTPEGAIQCAYHGWKFDGGSGECIDIPQLQPGLSESATQLQSRMPIAAADCCVAPMGQQSAMASLSS